MCVCVSNGTSIRHLNCDNAMSGHRASNVGQITWVRLQLRLQSVDGSARRCGHYIILPRRHQHRILPPTTHICVDHNWISRGLCVRLCMSAVAVITISSPYSSCLKNMCQQVATFCLLQRSHLCHLYDPAMLSICRNPPHCTHIKTMDSHMLYLCEYDAALFSVPETFELAERKCSVWSVHTYVCLVQWG